MNRGTAALAGFLVVAAGTGLYSFTAAAQTPPPATAAVHTPTETVSPSSTSMKPKAKAKPVAAVTGRTTRPPRPPVPEPLLQPQLHPTPAPSITPLRPSPSPTRQSWADQVIAFLRSKTGLPYIWGGTGPDGYDCSGLVQAAFATIGVQLPRTSQDQSLQGSPVPLDSLQPGDVLFWGSPGAATHDAVYIGDGAYIAAENPSRGIGVFTLSFSAPDFARRIS